MVKIRQVSLLYALHRKRYAPRGCCGLKSFYCLQHQCGCVTLGLLHGKFAGVDAGDVYQVANQAIHTHAVAFDTGGL